MGSFSVSGTVSRFVVVVVFSVVERLGGVAEADPVEGTVLVDPVITGEA